MCLIIKKPPGRRIPAAFLEHVRQHNADGWGCFYRQDDALVARRGMDFAELIELNRTLPLDREVHLHLRRATYGPVVHGMTHPFEVTPGLLLMHNGSLHHLAPEDSTVSDTWELARLLRSLVAGLSEAQAATLLRSEGFARLSAPLIAGSMVVLLDREGAVRLGRDWHVVSHEEWDGSLAGMQLSNNYAWTPRSKAVPAGVASAPAHGLALAG